ncbi:MAG: hypothetical protein HC817_04590 [Saprospiraceae bacterium]|nr:hypothetical protein [Saprospiraceae bacterium]
MSVTACDKSDDRIKNEPESIFKLQNELSPKEESYSFNLFDKTASTSATGFIELNAPKTQAKGYFYKDGKPINFIIDLDSNHINSISYKTHADSVIYISDIVQNQEFIVKSNQTNNNKFVAENSLFKYDFEKNQSEQISSRVVPLFFGQQLVWLQLWLALIVLMRQYQITRNVKLYMINVTENVRELVHIEVLRVFVAVLVKSPVNDSKTNLL